MFHTFESFPSQKEPVEHLFENETQAILFPYEHLAYTHRLPHICFIPEYCYTTIEENSGKALLMGPLDPCIGIFLLYKKNGLKNLTGFHFRTFLNSIEAFKKTVDTLLTNHDSAQVTALLHSTEILTDRPDNYIAIDNEPHTQERQKNIILTLAHLLNDSFNIPTSNITINLFKRVEDAVHEKYSNTYRSIIVDTDLKPRTIDLMKVYLSTGQYRVRYKDYASCTGKIPNYNLVRHIKSFPTSERLLLLKNGQPPVTIGEKIWCDVSYTDGTTMPFIKINTLNCNLCLPCKIDTLSLDFNRTASNTHYKKIL